MKQSDVTQLFAVPWASQADSSTIASIPTASTAIGRASMALGFPKSTMTPIAAGGVPPYGEDMNGILAMLSIAARASEAGVIRPFSASFANAIGGYPAGATIAHPTTAGRFLICTQDNNTNDPGQNMNGWADPLSGFQASGDFATNEALQQEVQRAKQAESGFLPLTGGTVSGDLSVGGHLNVDGISYYRQQLNLNGYNTANSNALSVGSEALPNGASCLIGGSVDKNYTAYMMQLFKDAHALFSIDNTGQIQTPAGAQFGGSLNVGGISYYRQQLNLNGYNTANSNALSVGSEALPNGASCLIGGSVAKDYTAYFLQLFKDAANVFNIDNTGQIQTPAGANFGGPVILNSPPAARSGGNSAVNADWVIDAMPMATYQKIVHFTALNVADGSFVAFPESFAGGNPEVVCTSDQGSTVLAVSVSGAVGNGFYAHIAGGRTASFLHIIAIGNK